MALRQKCWVRASQKNRVNIQNKLSALVINHVLSNSEKKSGLLTYVACIIETLRRFVRNNTKMNKRANLNNYKWSEAHARLTWPFIRKKKYIFIQSPNCKPALRVTGIRQPIFALSSFKSSLHTTEICLASPKEARVTSYIFVFCISKSYLLPFIEVQVWPNSLPLQFKIYFP